MNSRLFVLATKPSCESGSKLKACEACEGKLSTGSFYLAFLWTHSTFRHSLYFRKAFSECGISLESSVLFFTFLVRFLVFLLFCHWIHTRTPARVIHCTNNYPWGRKHCFFIALSGYPTFGTIFSGCRGFQIKWNMPIESWILRNWRRLALNFRKRKRNGVKMSFIFVFLSNLRIAVIFEAPDFDGLF